MSFKSHYKFIKKRLQQWRIFLGKKILDKLPKPTQLKLNAQDINSILFLRQDGKIGDYIVSSFVFREIKKQYPHIQLGVICNHKNQQLFENNKYIDKIHIVKEKSMFSYAYIGLKIRNQYDVIIDPTIFIRNRDLILLRCINAPYNIGYNKANYHIFNKNIPFNQRHFNTIYCQALNLCGFKHINRHYDIPHDTQREQAILTFLKNKHINHYIALNFFAAPRNRCFTENAIYEHLNYLYQHFPTNTFILLGHPKIIPVLKYLSSSFKNIFVYENSTSIHDSIELIRHAQALISPDTSTVHIAVGLNKPLIAIYHNENTSFCHWKPYPEKFPQQAHKILFFKENINEIHPQQIGNALLTLLPYIHTQ